MNEPHLKDLTLRVAVAIVGYRNPDDIVGCLNALAQSTHRDFEVVICENGGLAAYEALSRAIPGALAAGQAVRAFAAPRNLGYAGGVNAAIAAAPEADLWWVLNPDTHPDAGAMAALVGRMTAGGCDAAGGMLLRGDGSVQSWGGLWRGWLARAVSMGFGARAEAAPPAPLVEARQNYLSGASMMIGRRFLDTIGPMREDYFLYCEEVEWCLRARAAGLRLGFAPDARVVHDHGATTGAGAAMHELPRLPMYLGERNKILLTRDHFPLRFPIAAACALAMILLRYGRRGAWRQVGYGVSGWWAGVRNQRGVPAWLAAREATAPRGELDGAPGEASP